MSDLEFEPALPALAKELGSSYGHFAAAGLASFDSEAVPILLTAMTSTNPAVRTNAAWLFNQRAKGYYEMLRDPRFAQAALTWLEDPEPSVRIAGIEALGGASPRQPASAETLAARLQDPDAGVRQTAAAYLPNLANQIRFSSSATRIDSVSFSGSADHYTLTINGGGLGNLPEHCPFEGVTPHFRLFEVAQIGAGEWGYPGDAKTLIFESWSDGQIQISGLAARPGDAIQIWVSNPVTGSSATWGGNIPGGSGNPQITSVTFFGRGTDLRVRINGSGFGNAPAAMPFTGNLNQFLFADQRTHSGAGAFEAGGNRWGHGQPDPVTAKFQSWSDNQILIDGFAGAYGQDDGSTLQRGDPVYVVVWNGSATSQTGPQTAWGGFVSARPTTHLVQHVNGVPALPDGTGGQIRILSGTGDFASVSDASNTLKVSGGTALNGTLNLSVLNLGPGGAVAPLIYTPSWGDHSSSWRLIKGWVPTGQSAQQAQVSLVAPTVPGIYHIILAMSWEVGGDHVASGTSWGIGKDMGYGWVNTYDVWNDGNDIADFNAEQLSSAQANGWATNNTLNGANTTHPDRWYLPRPYPADAITLVVAEKGVALPAPSTTRSPDLQEIVKLSQTHMNDEVITNFIKSAGKTYKLSVDDIVYLAAQSVSQGVISVMLRTNFTPAIETTSQN